MLNKVILMGRLTRDPELKTTQSGTAVTTFTLAVDRRYKQDGKAQADFINCVAWRQTAEFVAKYFTKGQLIAVVGSIQTREYEDRNGNKRNVVEVIVDEATFAESKKKENSFTPGKIADIEADDEEDDELPF